MGAAAGANNRQYEHKRMIDTENYFLQFLPAIKNSEKILVLEIALRG